MGTKFAAGKAIKPTRAAPDFVDAVVMLRSPADGTTPASAQSKALATSVLSKAAIETGLSPDQSTVFENLHSFSVRAPKRFVDALARSDDVAQVVPNTMPRSALIEPVKKTTVKLPK